MTSQHSRPEPDHSSDEERIEKLVAMTVAAAKEIIPPGQVMLPLLQIANSNLAPPEIKAFAGVLIQLLKGNHSPDQVAGLPPHLRQAVADTVARINAPLPPDDHSGPQREGLSLPELLERVAQACAGNLLLWQQLWTFTEELEATPSTPPDIKTLAGVLRKILAGERQQHITAGLPPELAGPVNHLLNRLLDHSAPLA